MTATTETPDPGAHIADPAPLGLAAFALTTFLLSSVNAGLFAETVEPVVFGVAMAYGGLAQVLAGMWEFKKGNTFGATAFSSYGAFWISFWWLTGHLKEYKIPESDTGSALGLYLLAWTIFTAIMFIAVTKVNGALIAVFAALTLTFLALTIGEFTGNASIAHLGGWLGIITAVLAWYTALAGLMTFTFKKPVLPTFPL